MAPPDTQLLAEALAAFRATRSTYPSSSDQALTQLLERLAEELMALQRQPIAPSSQPTVSQHELAALQAQLATLQVAYEAQQVELARLRALVPSPRGSRLRSEVVSPSRVMRPMDYWEQRVPDYGDATGEADLATYRARPRMRPEDVALTAEDYARLERRRPPQQHKEWVVAVVMLAALPVGQPHRPAYNLALNMQNREPKLSGHGSRFSVLG